MSEEVNHLYKYRYVTDRSLRMLRENKYYFASIKSFNDPLDCAVEPIYELPKIDIIIKNQAKILQNNNGMSYQEALHRSAIIKDLGYSLDFGTYYI
jgi:hypothetical protein